MFVCFGVFIVACGLTHVMEIWTLWHGTYWLSGAIKAVTAAASVPTAILLARLVPKALLIPSPEALQKEIAIREQTEEALRTSEASFKAVVETANDAIISADSQGHVVSWNKGAERTFGYKAAEAVGQPLTFIMPERFQDAHRQGILRHLSGGESRVLGRTVELTGKRKDQTEFPLDVSLASWKNGDAIFFTGILRDSSERKKSEQKVRGLLEAAPDATVVDRDGTIVLVNAQVERLFGYKREEVLGQPISLLIPERFRDQYPGNRTGLFTRVQAGETIPALELCGLRKDGSEFPVEISVSPLETEEGQLVTSAIRDITERKKAQEGIQSLNEHLQRRSQELEAANKELEAFTYSVSHDLRAPLRHIDGFSKLLVEQYGPQLSEEVRECIKLICNGTREMGQLVDDLLSLAGVGRKELTLQLTALDSVIKEVVSDLERQNEGRVIDWQIEKLPFVECDAGLMKQVFVNLLSNAIKFTRPRERADIAVGVLNRDEGKVIFVRDNGVGFNMKYSNKLFGVFQRLHRQEDFEGTGVGLATIQRIIHKHGGRVWAEAELNKGATFYFTLGTAQQ
jgi:PAS domain S-box-containing protein